MPAGYVDKAKYLGVFIETKGNKADCNRQLRCIYKNANMLLTRFRKCSYGVKVNLFTTFCTTFYCPQFWYTSTKSCLYNLKVAYNNSLHSLLGIRFYNSASDMFASLHVPSFYEILRKTINGFNDRLSTSENKIVIASHNLSITVFSPINRWWREMVLV